MGKGRDLQDEAEEEARGAFLQGEMLRWKLMGDGCDTDDGSQSEERRGMINIEAVRGMSYSRKV